MLNIKKNYEIKAGDFAHGGDASMQVQGILKTVGCTPDIVRRAAICAYEAEMNVVMHGGAGTMNLYIDTEKIVLEVKDNGPGIPDIELAFKEGFSTAQESHRELGFGAGMGLPNIKKNVDSIEVESPEGGGTCLKMSFGMG
jgi:anti-sigma regulatory factor (Ser/Thr protein kinase)